MPITSPATLIKGAKATVAPRPILTKASLALFSASVILPPAELATISKPFCALPDALPTASRLALKFFRSSLSNGTTAVKPSISVKILDSWLLDVMPAAFNRLSTPVSPSVLRVVAAFVMPISSNAFCAF